MLGVFGFLISAAALAFVIFWWPDLMPPGLIRLTSESVATSSSVAAADQTAVQQSIIEQLRYLLGGLALGLAAIVTIQAVFQARHDRVQQQGIEQVSRVMTVVKELLESRLYSEQEARKAEQQAKEELERFKRDLEPINRLLSRQTAIIDRERIGIENKAQRLANQTARHGIRSKLKEFTELARQYDTFASQYAPLEEPPKEFTSGVQYVRGIAAHYNNDAGLAIECLSKVVELTGGDITADPGLMRRRAVAFYYLGITHTNFGHRQQALSSLLSVRPRENADFLSWVALAEAMASNGHADDPTSSEWLHDCEKEALAIEKAINERLTGAEYSSVLNHLRSRAMLVRVNAAVLRGTIGESTVALLQDVLAEDPDYYYAITTLAQIQKELGLPEARDTFQLAYDKILRSNDLYTVTEARSLILLHMTAALCLLNTGDKRHGNEQLEQATNLLPALPQIAAPPPPGYDPGETCTVFSVLTKRSEPKAVIEQHIRDIRAGQTLITGAGA